MSENTKIQWADHTFNPWEGCTKVSPGCANCYAEARNNRFGGGNWGKGKPRRRTSAANWKLPLKWNRQAGLMAGEATVEGFTHLRPRVFCASLADWLDDEVPIEWLADLLKLIHDTPNLDWLLLTKRPENFGKRATALMNAFVTLGEHGDFTEKGRALADWYGNWLSSKPPANVWLGTSVEDQQRADERIPALLNIPARIRFLSAEPLLGPIDFNRVGIVEQFSCLTGKQGWLTITGRVSWVIFGGESGRGARPCNVEWIRDGVTACRVAGVATFVKQLGGYPVTDEMTPDVWPAGTELVESPCVDFVGVRIRDKKGGDMSEWPEDLRVREFPQ